MEVVANRNSGRAIFWSGIVLLVLAVIIGPPISVILFVVAAIMIFAGGRIKRKSEPKAKPLSQKSPKSKMLAAMPAIILIALSLIIEKYSALLAGFGLMLLAYSITGVVEIYIDSRFPSAKSSWESLQGWKKFLISIAVITAAFLLVIALMPIVAKLIYG